VVSDRGGVGAQLVFWEQSTLSLSLSISVSLFIHQHGTCTHLPPSPAAVFLLALGAPGAATALAAGMTVLCVSASLCGWAGVLPVLLLLLLLLLLPAPGNLYL
jgi:ABC-type multidrug transport system permease subunit